MTWLCHIILFFRKGKRIDRPEVKGVAKGEGAGPPIAMPPMTKRMTAKSILYSILVFFIIFARAPSIQIFVSQFKWITREKFKVFVVKVATCGLHLTCLLQ